MGHYAASSGNSLPTFRDNLSVPSSGVKGLLGYYSLCNNPEERSSHTNALKQHGNKYHHVTVQLTCTILVISWMSITPLPSTSYIRNAHFNFSSGVPEDVTSMANRNSCKTETHVRSDATLTTYNVCLSYNKIWRSAPDLEGWRHQRKHILVTSEPSVMCQTTLRYTDVVSNNKLFYQRIFT